MLGAQTGLAPLPSAQACWCAAHVPRGVQGALQTRPPFIASSVDPPVATGGAKPGALASARSRERRAKRGGVIDMHHHFFSPMMKDSWVQGSGRTPPLVASWTPSRMLEEMDRNNVRLSVLSVASAPLHWFRMSPEENRTLTRSINEYGAELMRAHAGRLAQFAFVNCRDVDGSLNEIAYALDTLGACGVEMPTSFGDKWPGDPDFAPILEELNRRAAVVYFHPLAPFCCEGLIPGVHGSWLEYPYDTGRAIVSLLVSGAFRKYPRIKFVFSHGGGAIPVLAERIDVLSRSAKTRDEFAPEGSVLPVLRNLWFETANATSAPMMAALRAFLPVSQLMFGSDFPYLSVAENLDGLRAASWSDDELDAIERTNAQTLIPQLSTGLQA